jgi:alginate O-acetyltransferase complex protein AlgI
MVFSSIVFLFYFLPAFFICYFLAGQRYKNALILVGSILFYAWGAPRFIFVILGTTFVDFYIVRYMAASSSRKKRRALLCLSLAINLGLLFYFKYSNFFVDNLNRALAHFGPAPIQWAKLLLPIGISFYTFETITYVVDVYRRVHEPLKRFWDYQLYIILFPKLIAGPIVRFHDIANQVYDRHPYETPEYRLRGLYRFFIGLCKKVIIANTLGHTADIIFNMPYDQLGTATAWTGAISYTFQIYFDFSGYSDMAIGLALMMGFRLPENFMNPYSALSITDFWRKWHMTLGAWMREYLYIPLGGNRVHSKWRLYFNLWLVFLCSGFWHGATWGFIIWGAYHGFFLVIEKLFLLKWLNKFGKLSCVYTFFVVMLGWVLFRIEYFKPSLVYVRRMFVPNGIPNIYLGRDYLFMLGCAIFFSFITLAPAGMHLQQKIYEAPYTMRRHYTVGFTLLCLSFIAAGYISSSTYNPFIYFRF